eukprot:gene13618-biopygen16651
MVPRYVDSDGLGARWLPRDRIHLQRPGRRTGGDGLG